MRDSNPRPLRCERSALPLSQPPAHKKRQIIYLYSTLSWRFCQVFLQKPSGRDTRPRVSVAPRHLDSANRQIICRLRKKIALLCPQDGWRSFPKAPFTRSSLILLCSNFHISERSCKRCQPRHNVCTAGRPSRGRPRKPRRFFVREDAVSTRWRPFGVYALKTPEKCARTAILSRRYSIINLSPTAC